MHSIGQKIEGFVGDYSMDLQWFLITTRVDEMFCKTLWVGSPGLE